jgi:hypothetical protein
MQVLTILVVSSVWHHMLLKWPPCVIGKSDSHICGIYGTHKKRCVHYMLLNWPPGTKKKSDSHIYGNIYAY